MYYSIDILWFEAYNPSIMSALSERQKSLINPFNTCWVAEVSPLYGTEDPANIHLIEIVNRRYLPFYLTAARELTKVGLGPFNYEIAERQMHPDYADRPLTESFVALDYTGAEDRRSLVQIKESAKEYYWRLKNKGMADDMIELQVVSFTRDLAILEPGRIQASKDSYFLNTTAPAFYGMQVSAVGYGTGSYQWDEARQIERGRQRMEDGIHDYHQRRRDRLSVYRT